MHSNTEVIPVASFCVFVTFIVRSFILLALVFKCEGGLETFKDRTKGNEEHKAENSSFKLLALSA